MIHDSLTPVQRPLCICEERSLLKFFSLQKSPILSDGAFCLRRDETSQQHVGRMNKNYSADPSVLFG